MKRAAGIVCVIIVALMVGVCFLPETAMADFKQATKDTGKAMVNYPANVVNESAKVVGNAVKGTADTVVNTATVTGKAVVGQENPAKVVTTPVEGTGKMLYDATVETAEAPVKAGETTVEQNKM